MKIFFTFVRKKTLMKLLRLIIIFFSVFFPCKSQTTQKHKTKFIAM